MIEKEVWKSIPNYEGLYEVSSLGRVKSVKYNKEKILKYDYEIYLKVKLSKNGIAKNKRIHSLVAEAFLNHKPNGMEKIIDHINGDKHDNRVDNLQIVTQRQNVSKMKGNFSSKYIGVSFDRGRWQVSIYINKKNYKLGRFKTELEAHQAYQNKLKELI
jgi:hypothetical protein